MNNRGFPAETSPCLASKFSDRSSFGGTRGRPEGQWRIRMLWVGKKRERERWREQRAGYEKEWYEKSRLGKMPTYGNQQINKGFKVKKDRGDFKMIRLAIMLLLLMQTLFLNIYGQIFFLTMHFHSVISFNSFHWHWRGSPSLSRTQMHKVYTGSDACT